MRDDVKSLFESILKLTADKLGLLRQLRKSQLDKKTLLRNDDMSGLIDRIEEDANLMMMADRLSIEIADAKKIFCDTSGIEYGEFEKFFQKDDDESKRFTILNRECLSILKDLKKLNSNLEDELEKTLGKTGRDIQSLSRMRTLGRMLENPAKKD